MIDSADRSTASIMLSTRKVWFSTRKVRMDPQTELLLRSSSLDEQTIAIEGVPGPILGFHAQQAVEKLLKALLSQLGLKYPLTHDLERLVVQLAVAGEVLPGTPLTLKELSGFAVQFRYDDPLLVPPPDREKAIATVRIIREYVNRRVHELDPQP